MPWAAGCVGIRMDGLVWRQRLLGRGRQRWDGEVAERQTDRQTDVEPVGRCTGRRVWVIEPGSFMETGGGGGERGGSW